MKNEELNTSINDIVFENRNKNYGAYFLRKLYGNHINTAVIIAASSFALLLTFPIIYKKFFAEEKKEEKLEIVEVKLEEINIAHPEVPPPPQQFTAPPPKIDMVKFVPPVVKPDEEVKDEDEPPTEDELKDSNPGDKTQDGEKLNTVVESGTGSGEGTTPPPPPKPVEIATWVPEMPQFPGGPAEYLKYLKKHVRYPGRALDNEIEGTLKISFVVNSDGTLGDFKVLKGLGYGLDEEAIRVFKGMPAWKPGKQNGNATPVRLVYPVAFDISDE